MTEKEALKTIYNIITNGPITRWNHKDIPDFAIEAAKSDMRHILSILQLIDGICPNNKIPQVLQPN